MDDEVSVPRQRFKYTFVHVDNVAGSQSYSLVETKEEKEEIQRKMRADGTAEEYLWYELSLV